MFNTVAKNHPPQKIKFCSKENKVFLLFNCK